MRCWSWVCGKGGVSEGGVVVGGWAWVITLKGGWMDVLGLVKRETMFYYVFIG